MAATVISLVVSKVVLGHLPLMPFVSGIVVIVFGGSASICRTNSSSR